eukprot:1149352-Pelagomonas_calceolata.AAC.1
MPAASDALSNLAYWLDDGSFNLLALDYLVMDMNTAGVNVKNTISRVNCVWHQTRSCKMNIDAAQPGCFISPNLPACQGCRNGPKAKS